MEIPGCSKPAAERSKWKSGIVLPAFTEVTNVKLSNYGGFEFDLVENGETYWTYYEWLLALDTPINRERAREVHILDGKIDDLSKLRSEKFKEIIVKEATVGSNPTRYSLFNMFDPNLYTNHSGGALGADDRWDAIGRMHGFKNHIHYYHGKKTYKGNRPLTDAECDEGWERVLKANLVLKRNPFNYRSLLSRNWFQVKMSEAVSTAARVGQYRWRSTRRRPFTCSTSCKMAGSLTTTTPNCSSRATFPS